MQLYFRARKLSSIISHNQTSALEKNGNSTSILTTEGETIDDDILFFFHLVSYKFKSLYKSSVFLKG